MKDRESTSWKFEVQGVMGTGNMISVHKAGSSNFKIQDNLKLRNGLHSCFVAERAYLKICRSRVVRW
jgi:hypothetical protein